MVPKHAATRAKSRAYVYSDFPSRNNYIWALSHNLYSINCGNKHKTIAPQHDSLTPWSDDRIKATLDAERWHQLAQSICEFAIFACFGAMLALAYLT